MGWTELLLIGVVALIVVGPKDLPVLFRNMGRFMGKARGMAREFSRAMEDAADQAGVKEASETLRGLSNPAKYGLDKVKDATDFAKWDPDSHTGKLAAERAEAAKKIHAATADRAQNRLDAEAAAKAAEEAAAKAPADPATPVKAEAATPAQKAEAKTAAAKTPAAKKPAAKSKTAAAKTAAPKTTAKPAAKTDGKTDAKAKVPAKPRPAARPKPSQPKSTGGKA
ncbi:Sec-independent protein translocase protein TatB [Primorskyibacter flagellatus]|nr:Sec-independent protein translocase protein TatB [Primorskyibacter flagellatus]